jgi:hypothetical protein
MEGRDVFHSFIILLCAFIMLAVVAGCSRTPVATCPALVPYTPEQQTAVADELDTLPPAAETRRFMTDYGVLRAKLRECQP